MRKGSPPKVTDANKVQSSQQSQQKIGDTFIVQKVGGDSNQKPTKLKDITEKGHLAEKN